MAGAAGCPCAPLTVICASARCTAVSWVIRRARNKAGPLAAERPHRDVPRLPQHGDQPVRAGPQPAGLLSQVVRNPPVGDVAEGDGPGRPGADDLSGPALDPANVGGQLPAASSPGRQAPAG